MKLKIHYFIIKSQNSELNGFDYQKKYYSNKNSTAGNETAKLVPVLKSFPNSAFTIHHPKSKALNFNILFSNLLSKNEFIIILKNKVRKEP